jgi:hypothetical protein
MAIVRGQANSINVNDAALTASGANGHSPFSFDRDMKFD